MADRGGRRGPYGKAPGRGQGQQHRYQQSAQQGGFGRGRGPRPAWQQQPEQYSEQYEGEFEQYEQQQGGGPSQGYGYEDEGEDILVGTPGQGRYQQPSFPAVGPGAPAPSAASTGAKGWSAMMSKKQTPVQSSQLAYPTVAAAGTGGEIGAGASPYYQGVAGAQTLAQSSSLQYAQPPGATPFMVAGPPLSRMVVGAGVGPSEVQVEYEGDEPAPSKGQRRKKKKGIQAQSEETEAPATPALPPAPTPVPTRFTQLPISASLQTQTPQAQPAQNPITPPSRVEGAGSVGTGEAGGEEATRPKDTEGDRGLELAKEFVQKLLVSKPTDHTGCPLRPDESCRKIVGRQIRLVVNHIRITFPRGSAYHYDLDMTRPPKQPPAGKQPKAAAATATPTKGGGQARVIPKNLRWPSFLKWLSIYTAPGSPGHRVVTREDLIFDGNRNLFSKVKLPDISHTEPKEYQLTITAQDQRDPQGKEAQVQFLIQRARVHIRDADGIDQGPGNEPATVDLEELNAILDGERGDRLINSLPLNVVDLIFKQSMLGKPFDPLTARFTQMICVGKQWYPTPARDRPDDAIDIGDNVELRFGFFQSARPTRLKTLNVDTTAAPFVKVDWSASRPDEPLQGMSMLSYFSNVLGLRNQIPDRPLKYPEIRKLREAVRPPRGEGIQIITRHQRDQQGRSFTKKYRVGGVTNQPTHQLSFLDRDTNKPVLLSQYYLKQYRIKLKYLYLPCIDAGGTKQNPILIPPELCWLVAGENYKAELTPFQKKEMVQKSSTAAPERRGYIEEFLQKGAPYAQGQDPFLHRYGINFPDQRRLVQLNGHVLPLPSLRFGNNSNRQLTQNDSKFPLDKGPCPQFHTPAKSTTGQLTWGFLWLNYSNYQDQFFDKNYETFKNNFVRAALGFGMKFQSTPIWDEVLGKRDELFEFLRGLGTQRKKPDLIFVLLPLKSNDDYAMTKRIAETNDPDFGNIGVLTQCLKHDSFENGKRGAKVQQMAFAINVCLKVNAKLGGTDWVVDLGNLFGSDLFKLFEKNDAVMFMGADVYHPPPSAKLNKPSVAAVVASTDPFGMRYSAVFSVQAHRTENIQEMKGLTKQLLLNYFQVSRKKPKHIVFFRDGVAETHYPQINQMEIENGMRAAFKEMSKDGSYVPKLTYIVVAKRHHTRMFVQNSQDAVGKFGNVPPGTVVDEGIVHPVEMDFFLMSQYPALGTAKPTYYHVLCNDHNFDMNSIELISYYMCYACFRCSQSISIPAPAYYAHLVAERSKNYLIYSEDESSTDTESVMSGAGTGNLGAGLTRRERKTLAEQLADKYKELRVHENLTTVMYFV